MKQKRIRPAADIGLCSAIKTPEPLNRPVYRNRTAAGPAYLPEDLNPWNIVVEHRCWLYAYFIF